MLVCRIEFCGNSFQIVHTHIKRGTIVDSIGVISPNENGERDVTSRI